MKYIHCVYRNPIWPYTFLICSSLYACMILPVYSFLFNWFMRFMLFLELSKHYKCNQSSDYINQKIKFLYNYEFDVHLSTLQHT